jgi:hypothetical protein
VIIIAQSFAKTEASETQPSVVTVDEIFGDRKKKVVHVVVTVETHHHHHAQFTTA